MNSNGSISDDHMPNLLNKWGLPKGWTILKLTVMRNGLARQNIEQIRIDCTVIRKPFTLLIMWCTVSSTADEFISYVVEANAIQFTCSETTSFKYGSTSCATVCTLSKNSLYTANDSPEIWFGVVMKKQVLYPSSWILPPYIYLLQ